MARSRSTRSVPTPCGLRWRINVEADHTRCFGRELRIIALAPRLPRSEIDIVLSAETAPRILDHSPILSFLIIDQNFRCLYRAQVHRPVSQLLGEASYESVIQVMARSVCGGRRCFDGERASIR